MSIQVEGVYHWLTLKTIAVLYWLVPAVGRGTLARYEALTCSGRTQHSLCASRAGVPHFARPISQKKVLSKSSGDHRKKKTPNASSEP